MFGRKKAIEGLKNAARDFVAAEVGEAKPVDKDREEAMTELNRREVEYRERLKAVTLEDAMLREDAKKAPTGLEVIDYPNGKFLKLPDGVELPIYFIEDVSLSVPDRDKAGSYAYEKPPYMSRMAYVGWQQLGGYCGITKATIKFVMSSGRKHSVQVNPYACEAILAAVRRAWKTGEVG